MKKNFAFYLAVVIFPLIIVALITAIILIKPAPKASTEAIQEATTTTVR